MSQFAARIALTGLPPVWVGLGSYCPSLDSLPPSSRYFPHPSTERGYGPYWRKRRAEFLETHPICCVDGCGQKATVADHFPVSVTEGRRRGWTWQQIHADSNLRPMCERHHNSRTSRDQGWGKSRESWG